jgi:hypothetical protein
MRDDFAQDYTSSEETMVWNHDLTLPLPFLDIPHENLHSTFCREDQCTPHQEQKNEKNPYKPPGENGYPMDHCYCGETHPPELDDVIRIQRLNPRKACRCWQQGRRICHHCGFHVNLTEHSLRCSNPNRIPISPCDNDIRQTTPINNQPAPSKGLGHHHTKKNDVPQRVQREQTPGVISQNQPTTTPNLFSTQDHRRPYHPWFPKSQRHSNPRQVRKTAYLPHRKSLVGASALERGLMSRITNDMLLGAIAASTGLWVIGIMVTVSYLVTTA